MSELVSIITPTYNAEKFIRATIESNVPKLGNDFG
jgi:glycosyltransferase involved in cell wall biosynthesis